MAQPALPAGIIDSLTYLGGSGIDHIQAVALDSAGNSILAGVTTSQNFPGGHPSSAGAASVFVSKLNASGSALLFTTMLGSRPNANPSFLTESVASMALDSDGSIYVAGISSAPDFPTTPGAWQPTPGGAFVTKLDPTGKVVYSTFLGSSVWGLQPQRIRVRNGIAYVAGLVYRPEFFGTSAAIQRSLAGGDDFFVLALSADGSSPTFVTALGGSGQDYLSDMALETDGSILLAGTSTSADFPRTADAMPYPAPAANQTSAVLARIDATGARLLYSTFLGTQALRGLTVLSNGDFVIAGWGVLPPDLIAAAPHSAIAIASGSSTGYAARFTASNKPVWTSQLGVGTNLGQNLMSDDLGNLYWLDVCSIASGGALTTGGFSGIYKLSADGSILPFCSPLPATGTNLAASAAIGPAGQVLAAGWTNLPNLPVTPGALQPQRDPANAGTGSNADDGYVALLDLSSFTAGNFYLQPYAQQPINWRIGEPLPGPVAIPLLVSGNPGPLTVTPSSRITATYSPSASAISVNANPAQTASGTFTETVTVRATNPIASASATVNLTVLPQVGFTLATSQLQFRVRQGQDLSAAAQTVAITMDSGGTFVNFDVSSDSSWLSGYVIPDQTLKPVLRVSVLGRPPGTYDGVLTLNIDGIPNPQKTLQVHYIVEPPATIQVSTTSVSLHIVQGKPAPTAVVSVTGSVPGVGWGIWPVGGYPGWLSFSQTSTTTPAELHISADPASAQLGVSYFTVLVNGENNQQISISGQADVSSGAALDVVPNSVTVTYTRGATSTPAVAFLSFVAPTTANIQWSVDQAWVAPGKGSGSTPLTIGLSFDTTMPEGVYHATLTAKSGATTVSVPITFNLYDAPHLVFPTAPIHFAYRIGGTAPAPVQIPVTCPTLNSDYYQVQVAPYGNFLSVDPTYGRTPATLSLTANVQGLTAGTYHASLSITSYYPDTTHYPSIPVTLDVLPDPNAPTAAPTAVVDSASFLGGAISPGEILTVYGSAMGPSSVLTAQPDDTGRFPTALSGSTFYFDELPAPIVYVSAKQAAVVAPFGIAGRSKTNLTVQTSAGRSATLVSTVTATNPAIFTADSSGMGLAAALNAADDGTLTPHGVSNPVARGGIVILYATGLGTTTPVLPDGASPSAPLPALTQPVTVFIGGLPATSLYAGPAPGLIAGLMQINVRIPAAVPPGTASVLITAGDNPSQPGVNLAIR